MKSNKVLKILIVFLLLGCLVPSVSAKKNKIVVRARARGNANGVPIRIMLRAKVSQTTDGDYEGPARMAYITPPQKVLTDPIEAVFRAEMGDEGVLGFKVEINGQFIPIKSKIIGEKTVWVTEGAEITINGKPVVLNLVWNLVDQKFGGDWDY